MSAFDPKPKPGKDRALGFCAAVSKASCSKLANKHFSFVEWSQRFGSNILEAIPK